MRLEYGLTRRRVGFGGCGLVSASPRSDIPKSTRGMSMRTINLGAVLRGGAVAAITFAIVEFILEGVVGIFGLWEADLLREAYPDVAIGGAIYHVGNVVYLFVFFIFAIWMYAAIRPRFGAGPRTALIISLALWFMYLQVVTNLVRQGLFPVDVAVASLAFNLIEIPLAVLMGARFYSEPAEPE